MLDWAKEQVIIYQWGEVFWNINIIWALLVPCAPHSLLPTRLPSRLPFQMTFFSIAIKNANVLEAFLGEFMEMGLWISSVGQTMQKASCAVCKQLFFLSFFIQNVRGMCLITVDSRPFVSDGVHSSVSTMDSSCIWDLESKGQNLCGTMAVQDILRKRRRACECGVPYVL